MTTFLLIRHASHDWLGKGLAGRISGVSLNELGRREAETLAQRLERARVDALYSSPRERTLETAFPVASRRQLDVRTLPELDEIDFGEWNGKMFSELEADPEWPTWVNRRSQAQPPNGEPIQMACDRALRAIERLASEHADGAVALFSHGDVIKSVLANHLGVSLDELERFDVAPASISVLLVGDGWSRVTLVNDTGDLAPPNGS